MEEQITGLIEEGKFDEAIALISQAIVSNNEDDRLYFLRGKVHWKKGMRKEAMNDYASAIRLNPDSPAKIAMEQARAVANFFNPDLLNP
ncbi:MAG: tetratricopeptide repeat protein [Bacteroidales bacterium]|nr:tetratricopeptide repeat protein [Bacteroidales bacterium]